MYIGEQHVNFGASHLYRLKGKISGKNWMYFCFNETVHMIFSIDPLIIYQLNNGEPKLIINQTPDYLPHLGYRRKRMLSSNSSTNDSTAPYTYKSSKFGFIRTMFNDNTIRGGTSGVQIGTSNWVWGVGHRTQWIYNRPHDPEGTYSGKFHRPFLWLINMYTYDVFIRVFDSLETIDLTHPVEYIHRVVDATDVVQINGIYHLVTGESENHWSTKGSIRYWNNVYKIEQLQKLYQLVEKKLI